MGRRIDSFIELVRFLRAMEPKYSFEITVFNGCLLIASTVLLIMDEYKLYVIAALMLLISLGIQTLRIRRVTKRKRLELEDLRQSCLAYYREQYIADENKNNREQHAAETDRLIALLREDVEQAIQDADRSGRQRICEKIKR